MGLKATSNRVKTDALNHRLHRGVIYAVRQQPAAGSSLSQEPAYWPLTGPGVGVGDRQKFLENGPFNPRLFEILTVPTRPPRMDQPGYRVDAKGAMIDGLCLQPVNDVRKYFEQTPLGMVKRSSQVFKRSHEPAWRKRWASSEVCQACGQPFEKGDTVLAFPDPQYEGVTTWWLPPVGIERFASPAKTNDGLIHFNQYTDCALCLFLSSSDCQRLSSISLVQYDPATRGMIPVKEDAARERLRRVTLI